MICNKRILFVEEYMHVILVKQLKVQKIVHLKVDYVDIGSTNKTETKDEE